MNARTDWWTRHIFEHLNVFDQDQNEPESNTVTFVQWLREGTREFHVAGKLRSEKSTLMKFLYSHPRTIGLLREWAGSKKLVLAGFFFWRAGSEEQKSLDGLIRSLLHDTLEQCPDLIPEVFQEEWERAVQSDPKVVAVPTRRYPKCFPSSYPQSSAL